MGKESDEKSLMPQVVAKDLDLNDSNPLPLEHIWNQKLATTSENVNHKNSPSTSGF